MEKSGIGSFIDGNLQIGNAEEELRSPVDGALFSTVYPADSDTVLAAIESAHDTFEKTWSTTKISERQELLRKLASIIEEKTDTYAELESLTTGKTLRQSLIMDVPLAISHMEYFATTNEFKRTRTITHPEFPGTEGIVENAPMGVVAAITPWNVPLLMAVWKIAPAVLAGNTVVIKPSIHTPVTTVELAKDAKKAGFPDGVINVVVGNGGQVGEKLCNDDRVSMISFTGSTATGKEVMNMAANGVKKITLELGGKSPSIVMRDAEIEHAAKGVLFGIYLNSGQLCESGSRLIVHRDISEKFLLTLRHYLENMRAGNPMDMTTDISAITTREQLSKIRQMVDNGIAGTDDLIYQKDIEKSVPPDGYYYPPTLLHAEEKSSLYREEIFGPVLAVSEFETEDEAVRIANDSDYGLAAAIWSTDVKQARLTASRIQAGTVWINDYHLLSAAAPRGGFKKSGIGRELGLEGILEYTQARHIFVNEKESDMDRAAYGLLITD